MSSNRTPARMTRLVTTWRASGESGASFARRHPHSAWTFWYWCRKLAAETRTASADPAPATFVPVRMAMDPDAPVIEIAWGSGDRLHVRPVAPADPVRAVVTSQTIENALVAGLPDGTDVAFAQKATFAVEHRKRSPLASERPSCRNAELFPNAGSPDTRMGSASPAGQLAGVGLCAGAGGACVAEPEHVSVPSPRDLRDDQVDSSSIQAGNRHGESHLS